MYPVCFYAARDLPTHSYIQPLPNEASRQLYFGAATLAIWHLRPATQRRFPLHKGHNRDWLRYLAWCATDGRKEYGILREIPSWDDELVSPVALPALTEDHWSGTYSLTNFLHGIAMHRWSLSGMLGNANSRHRATRHFWRGARHRNHAPPIAAWQRDALLQKFGTASQMARDIAMHKHAGMPDSQLAKLYGLDDLAKPQADSNRNARNPIKLPKGLTRSLFPLPQPIARLIDPLLQPLRVGPSQAESTQLMSRIDTTPSAPHIAHSTFGVNLIGFAQGELGIGEDIRQVALALAAYDIPVCIIDFAPGKNISQADDSARRLMSDEPRYGINVFCLTGIETTRYVCERGLSTVEGRYNIGLWPWELPDWPENCRHAYACVDEIWGISEFTANAHRFAAPRPVIPMGLPVELGTVGKQTRRDFGLPDDAYLFAFAFDLSSSTARKNPEGLIDAFQRAFPVKQKEEVGLVLKVSNPETKCRLWKRIRRAARRDRRIHLIERNMRRPELLALMNACDCYVSLHRGEGFGRSLAEAMLLGKQVIATGFSGNLDFCREPRVALVRHSMTPLAKEDYMWGEGQSWAEPDIEHAAQLMREVRVSPRDTSKGDFPFSPSVVGARYAARLREIWAQHGPDNSERSDAHFPPLNCAAAGLA